MDIINLRAELFSLYERAENARKIRDKKARDDTSESLSLAYREMMNEYHEIGDGKVIFDLAIGVAFKDKRNSVLCRSVDGMLSSFSERQFIVVIDASRRYSDENIHAAIVLGCSSCIGALVHCNETISAAIEKYCTNSELYKMQKFGFLPDARDINSLTITKEIVEERLDNFHFSDVQSSPISCLSKLCFQFKRVNYFHPTHCTAAIFGEMLDEEAFYVAKGLS